MLPPQDFGYPGLPAGGLPCQAQLLNNQQQPLNYPPQFLSNQAQGPSQLLAQQQAFNIPPELLAQLQGGSNFPPQLLGQQQTSNIPPQFQQQQGGMNLPPQFLQPQVLNLPPQLCNPQQDAFPAGQVQMKQISPQDYQIPLGKFNPEIKSKI